MLNKLRVFNSLPPAYISDHFWTLNVSVLCLQEEEERGKRQVLVLGLDGAGKSSMLQGLTPGESAAKRGRCRPTRGFNFMSLNAPACQLDFLESKTPFISPKSNAAGSVWSLEGIYVLSNSSPLFSTVGHLFHETRISANNSTEMQIEVQVVGSQ